MTLDANKADAFEEQLVNSLNAGAACLMTSIGHRTGLFDAMENLDPASSTQIADAANLDERYVREWLGAMTVSGFVEHDAGTGHYVLPKEHARMLTRSAGAENVAVFAQYIAELGSVENDIVACFKEGGGVGYEKFSRFHEIMAEDSGQSVLPALETDILPLVPNIQTRLTSGIDVLDLGCGRGKALNMLAARYPASRFTGYDLSAAAVAYATGEAFDNNLTNVQFVARDLSDFHESATPEAFDFITTFDAVHDQAKPLNLLIGIARTLRQDGYYLMQDIDDSTHHHENVHHPIGTLLYTISCMHCMTVSLAQNGDGLGAMWGHEKATELLHKAGFKHTDIHRLAHDIQNAYYVSRK